MTFDEDPAGARLAGRNLTWTQVPRSDIVVGASDVTLKTAALASTVGAPPTGVRYAWCVGVG